jgi:nitrate reductase assembly molybdenum cofactor insertion protein NarJ
MRLSDLWPPTRFSDLWSVLVLGAAAAALLLLGRSVTKDALVAAGFALAGAAITRLVDVMQERARSKATAQERRRVDLDETRRLCYTALFHVRMRGSAELMATVANALVHHGSNVPIEEAASHLPWLLHLNETENTIKSRRWLEDQIARITAQLDADAER